MAEGQKDKTIESIVYGVMELFHFVDQYQQLPEMDFESNKFRDFFSFSLFFLAFCCYCFVLLVLKVAEWRSMFGFNAGPRAQEEQSQMVLYVISPYRRLFLREKPACELHKSHLWSVYPGKGDCLSPRMNARWSTPPK